jgi:hypothetical protein
MKLSNYFLLLIVACATIVVSCKKDKTNPDFAGAIAGTYYGTISISGSGTSSAVTKITKVNETTIGFEVIIGSTSLPITGISINHPSENTYTLIYADSSGSLTGTVIGITLTWTLTDGNLSDSFTGSRMI